MNSIWQEFLGASGARIDHGLVMDFGDAAAELAAARDATIVSPLTHLGLIDVAGPDGKDFLHHQLTSDVNHLAADAAQHSAWCSAKGRMLASFLIFRSGPDYHLQLAADLLPAMHRRLQMFILRSKVTVADQSGCRELVGLSGPQAEMALQTASLPIPAGLLSTAAFAEGVVIRLDNSRFEIAIDSDAATRLWPDLQSHARPAGTAVWQWLDIQAGIPLITAQTKEEFVPQMADFERLGAVSFHKGCYPGQEIIARTQYLGKVKRHLYRAHSASPMAAGNAIFSPANPDHPCGMVANAAPAPTGGYDALVVVQENFVAAGDLELASPGGPRIDLRSLSS
ncbi:Folate-binding protein YgfZ [Candidatus Accumulibacter aalborgensis]|uniref:Folate-binding protein YgfZ n=1 Tax=Candidatus Accumulibacter aalborgensis TaxID=1860102 RepID=A0A1A8XI68_9PROT|nr:folate-binding protein YgfZ [Candidatus Accumulibacter aalborgensis]SBT04067.1 Folate-binding protein YgfZ [Candidatus Accumulibacter aalborgensis]